MIETPKLMQTINGGVVGTSQEPSLPADEDTMGARLSSASDGYGYGGRMYRVRSFHATPTASPEASWNSQNSLLSNPPGAIPVSMTKKSSSITNINDHNRKRSSKLKWLWGRRCPCPCSGKKSVQVEPKTPLASSGPNQKSSNHKPEEILLAGNPYKILSENQFQNSTARSLTRTDSSTATGTTNTAAFTFPMIRNHNSLDDHHDQDPPPDSLERFQPKKLSSRINVTEDDGGSDTSSDLFEIDSFSTTINTQTTSNPPYHRRDSLDEASIFSIRTSISGSCPYSEMTNECYEPSEVSIDWSVTTAEGFKSASVAVSEAELEETNMITAAVGGKKKSSGELLMSCRYEKAVSVVVGPNPVKNVSPEGQAAKSISNTTPKSSLKN